MRWLLLSVCLLVLGTCVSPALADDAPTSAEIKKAATQYDLGRERFREESYTEAAERFEAADGYAPSAPALRLAMLSRQEAGQMERAATLAALALERHPDETELVSEAEQILRAVDGQLGRVHVTCDSPCELVLNNRLVHGRASQDRLLYIEPGRATLRAGWSGGRNQTERVQVALDTTREVSFYTPLLDDSIPVAPVDETEEDPAQEEKRKGWKPGVFWTGLGLTTVGAAATVGLGLNALNNPGRDQVIEDCMGNDKDCETYKKGRRHQTYANVALGTTIGLGVFTLVTGIFLTDWGGGKKKKKDEQKPAWENEWGRVHVRPMVSIGQGALVGASGTF